MLPLLSPTLNSLVFTENTVADVLPPSCTPATRFEADELSPEDHTSYLDKTYHLTPIRRMVLLQ